MTPLEMIAEWRKGCTIAGPMHSKCYPDGEPIKTGYCVECTEGLIDALESRLKSDRDEIVAAMRWALGMAEEAIIVRESGDDEEDTPDIIAMHRGELETARALLARIEAPSTTITCTQCGWAGNEDDLHRCNDAEDGERADACPTCGTDNFLMDRPDTRPHECASSPTGRHIVDTSMESGPNNCFHCDAPMGKPSPSPSPCPDLDSERGRGLA